MEEMQIDRYIEREIEGGKEREREREIVRKRRKQIL
jgi:hypothetical protein